MIDPASLTQFRRIATSIDVAPILAEIRANRSLWYVSQVRQQTVKAQAETNNIPLRRGVRPADRSLALDDTQEIAETDNWPLFSRTAEYLNRFAAEESGQLSRAMIVRLKPQGRVFRHIDHGAYYAIRDRYHLVIQSPGGSEMKSGGETAIFQPGELWCFNNKAVHEAFNRSNDWRIHLIFDLVPRGRPLRFNALGSADRPPDM
ncbi:MAG: aspartyl/asparaginyl beta-hydroxylase domain-containing protein [Reyranella sp.]|nr:aspartyl/asparaginyl beta-hydroxylase domain-containing protein [Reyranella sp.]